MLVVTETVLGIPETTCSADCMTVTQITDMLYQIEESRILFDHFFLKKRNLCSLHILNRMVKRT